MEKLRTNIYIEKDAYKKFKILCIQEDKSISEKIEEYIKRDIIKNEENK